MSLHRKVCLLLVGLSVSCAVIAGEADKKVYDGKVVEYAKPGLQSDIRFGIDGFNGLVTWIKPAGSFVKGPVYNSKGEIIRRGDLLMKADPRFYEYDVKCKEAEVEAAKAELANTDTNRIRYKKLATTSSVSKKEYDNALADYLKARAYLKKVQSELEYSKLLLSECSVYAPYSGYVQEVFARVGSWCNLDYPGLRLMRLTPLYIDVKMPRDIARKIINNDIAVSVESPVTKDKIGVNNSKVMLIDQGVRMPIDNSLVPNSRPKHGEIIVRDYFCVREFSPLSKSLSVPESCLYKEGDKYYVWQAVDQKDKQPGETPESIFKLKKIYVVPGDMLRNSAMDGQIHLLSNSGTLKNDDIIISDAPENIEDGATVVYRRFDALFWPGDKVKVFLK